VSKIDLLYVCTVPATIKLFMKGQIPFMKRKGFSIGAAASPGKDLLEISDTYQIQVYPVPFKRAPSLFSDVVSLIGLFRLFLRVKPTIVHSSTSKAGPFAMVAAFFSRVPVRVYTLRGILVDRRDGLMKWALKAVECLACHCAHQVIAVSTSVAEFVVAEHLCPAHKVKVLGNGSSNGVDAVGLFNPEKVTADEKNKLKERLGIPRSDKVVGFIGRLVAGKGIADLASAWRMVSSERPDVRLVVIGAPEDQAPVAQEILNELRNDKKVIMIDSVDQRHLPVYYAIVNAVAFPTLSEGFPNVPLEAAAMEVPVVASRVTGCVDAIQHNVTGMLFPAGDRKALAEKILTYLNDADLSARHGRAARRHVLSKFRPEFVWESLYREYLGLLKERGITLVTESQSRHKKDLGKKLTVV